MVNRFYPKIRWNWNCKLAASKLNKSKKVHLKRTFGDDWPIKNVKYYSLLKNVNLNIFTDKSAGFYSDRFKTQNLPSEYICVDDLHYYRRRKPSNYKSIVSF